MGLVFRQLGFPETNVVLLYLLAVLLTAWITRGYACGVLASLAATLVFNYFFTAPYWSLSVDDPSYWITFVIMTITAFITSALTSKAKLNAQNALQREQEIKTMYALSRRLNEEIDIRQIARLAAEVLAGVLQAEVRCLWQPFMAPGQVRAQCLYPAMKPRLTIKPDSRRAGTPSRCRCKTTAFGWQCCKFR